MENVQRVRLAPSDSDDFVFFFDHQADGHTYSREPAGDINALSLAAAACCFKLNKGASAVVDVYHSDNGKCAFDCRIEGCSTHTPIAKSHFSSLAEMAPVFNSAPTTALFLAPGPISGTCSFPPPAPGQPQTTCGDGNSSVACPPGASSTTHKAECVGGKIACVQKDPPE
ncbi:MAG: hypothetical protein AB8B55_20855 [Mariniblastus sp.]